jgi:phosphate:Na+ symporter
MVTTAVLRAYGTDFRRWLERSLSWKMNAFLVGLAVTAVLQSSTATGLMATSFAASGIIDLTQGLAVMLGANVGTTLIVQVLSFDIGIVAPILILVGVIFFRRASDGHIRNIGRIGIGLGLMLLALNLLVRTMSPIKQVPQLGAIVGVLVTQPVLMIALSALLTWACHSSVAVVLLILSLVKSDVLAPAPALLLVLGANLGATFPALLESGTAQARRLPLGNLLVRGVGAIVVLPMLPFISILLARIDPEPTRMVVNFHTAFNLGLAALFILPLHRLAKLLIWLLPDPAPSADIGAPQHLEETALRTASVALINAGRETLRMADMVEAMLKGSLAVFRDHDSKLASEISRMDLTLDRIGVAVRHYLARLNGEELNKHDSFKSQETFTFTINLDYIGDILANLLTEFASSRITQSRSFPAQVIEGIAGMHSQVIESLNLGVAIFLRGEEAFARQLVERKRVIWQLEAAAAESYFLSLRETAQTGSGDDFYLRILRDLKRIHSLIAALAYPILDRAGHLQNRLVEPSGDEHHGSQTTALSLKTLTG